MPKAAFIVVTGRPSVGKSTLVNLLCGAKVSIVSPVPQTTRNAIRGILTRPEGQLVFVDTPGRHISEKKLNKKLTVVSDRALDEAELVLYVLDASRSPGPEEESMAERIRDFQDRTAAVINKCDAGGAEPLHRFLDTFLPNLEPARRFEVSCLKKEGTAALVDFLFETAPEGDPFYPGEYYTDQAVNFRIGEIIREKAMNRLREELPHSIYVDVADTELREGPSPQEKRLWVRAFIVTERESQKGMIVGKGGEMIKAIGRAARKELNTIFDWKVDLDLRVKTGRDWRHKDHVLRKITGN